MTVRERHLFGGVFLLLIFRRRVIPRQILAKYGYDPAVLGQRRVWGISGHIREQYNKYGGFHEGTVYSARAKSASLHSGMPASEKDELKQLRYEVDYLKQEVAFLKKFPPSEPQGSRGMAYE